MTDNNQSREIIEEWQCPQCHRELSANRAPTFNAKNCNCVEAGSHDDVAGQGVSQPLVVEQLIYSYESPQSFTSSSVSVRCNHPDGSEPDLAADNPKMALNESHHRRSFIREDMSFQMHRFLREGVYPETSTLIGNISYRDTYMQLQQTPEKKRTRSPSIVSRMSMQSCGSAHSMMSMRYSEVAAGGWGTDAVAGVGAWYDDGEDAAFGHLTSSGFGEFTVAEFDNGPVNVMAGPASATAFPDPKRDVVEDSPVYPSMGSSKGNSYPLPPEWMTRCMSSDGHQSSLAEPLSTTRNKPRVSLVALAKAAILLKRWMRKKRPPALDERFILSPDFLDPVLDITREDQASILPDHPDENHISISPCNKEEVASSSYADSVDSLENESTEDSQDSEETPSRDEFATCQDILYEFLPIFDLLPRELLTELSSRLEFLMERWLNNKGTLQHPVQSGEAHQSSGSPPAGISPTFSTPSGSGKKRASTNGDGSSSPGARGGGNGKRPKIRVELQPGSTTRRWACPFYQREPHRYCLGKWRLCAKSPGFREVHRVKTHIYDHHAAIYCERCYTMFASDDDLLSHRRQLLGCNVRSPRPLEGLTKEQKELLRPRDRNKSEDERWKTVYRICFPDDDTIPSPYFVHYSRETAELRREIFEILRQEIPQSEHVNRERLLQRVQNAFEGRLNLPSETPDTESNILVPDGPTPQSDLIHETFEVPLHGILPLDPPPLRQAHHFGSIESDLTQEPIFDDFGEILYWGNLPANDRQVSMNEQMPLHPDLPLPLQIEGSFDNGLH